MSTSVMIDVSVLLSTAGERKHYNSLVNMEPLHRGDEELPFIGPVEVDAVIESVKRGVLYVKGDASGMLRIPCYKCLEEMTEPFGADLSVTYCVPMRVKVDEDCRLVDGHEIDLGPAIEEAFLLTLPMKLVCSDDCKGLCSVCGTNLNTHPEHSHEAAPDTRFSDLGRLLGGEWQERDKEDKSG